MYSGTRCNIYGLSYAMQFHAERSQKDTYWTVMIEAAKKSGGREFDWPNKCVLAPKEEDVNLLSAVFCRLTSSYQTRTKNGYIEISWQDSNLDYPMVARLYSNETEHKVPVSRGMVPKLASCFFDAGRLNLNVSIQSYLTILRATVI